MRLGAGRRRVCATPWIAGFRFARWTAIGLLSAFVAPAHAQESSDRDLGDYLLYGGQVAGSFAKHDIGYFNQIDYLSSTLRLFRANLQLELRVSERFAVLTEIRTDNFERVEAYAWYARISPWRGRVVDIQVGRVPPVFGAFSRRRYEADNPLIGYPLGYQYATNIRPDAAPAGLAELRDMRARGAKTRYSVGNREVAPGLSLFNPIRWDTGIQLRVGDRPVELALALTQGTLGNPRVSDDNPGKQLAGRVRVEPTPHFVWGVSGSRGRYDTRELQGALVARGQGGALFQTAFGVDGEISAGDWILRSEAIWSRWDSATLATDLDSVAAFVEARYKIRPGLYAAARLDHLTFGRVDVSEPFRWDAPVSRIETGVGYYWHRQFLTKLSFQHNERDGGRRSSDSFVAVQAVFWF